MSDDGDRNIVERLFQQADAWRPVPVDADDGGNEVARALVALSFELRALTVAVLRTREPR